MEPLTDACYLGQLKDARAILDGPDPPSLSSKSTGLELSYVGAAVMAFVTAPSMPPCPDVPEHLAIIKLLIERGAPVDAIDARGDTPLTLAALHGLDSPVVIRMLADAGANLNHRDKGGRTALFTHAQHGRVDSVQALLDAGAQLEIDSADGTSIAAAFLRGGVAVGDVLKRYLRAHPDLPVRLPWKIRGVVQSMPGATLGDGAVNVSPELRALCARPLLNVSRHDLEQSDIVRVPLHSVSTSSTRRRPVSSTSATGSEHWARSRCRVGRTSLGRSSRTCRC